MVFNYRSSVIDQTRQLSDDLVKDIRQYLLDNGVDRTWDKGEIQAVLLEYRTPKGARLLINQLEPIFVYVSIHGKV